MKVHLSHFLMDFGLALNKLMLTIAGETDREAMVITQEMSEQTMRSSFVPIFSAFGDGNRVARAARWHRGTECAAALDLDPVAISPARCA
jgi:hypothetical protein